MQLPSSYHFSQKLPLQMGVCAMILLLFFIAITKLIQPAPQQDDTVMAIDAAAAQTSPDNSRSALLYALLLAEMAWQNNQWDIATQQYLLVAQATNDVHIARLATSAALQHEDLQLARQASTLWAKLAPQEPEAQAIAITLLFKSGDTQASLPYLTHLLQLTEQEQTTFFSLIFLSLEENEQQAFLETLHTLNPDLQIEEARLAWSR